MGGGATTPDEPAPIVSGQWPVPRLVAIDPGAQEVLAEWLDNWFPCWRQGDSVDSWRVAGGVLVLDVRHAATSATLPEAVQQAGLSWLATSPVCSRIRLPRWRRVRQIVLGR